MRLKKYKVLCAGVFFSLLASVQTLQASPWAAVGDMQLRNDVEILARHGVISGPVNTWPISWKQITRNLSRSSEMDLPSYVRLAVMRVKAKIPGEFRTRVRIQATNNPAIVRGFSTTARNDLDADAIAEYNSDSGTTIHIQGGYRKGNGEDYAHLDGSYISQDIGNWSAYAGAFDRWWGPGRESTLILSNNARPMPSVGLRRIEPKAFKTKWLSWMGPWQWDMFVARMEEDRHISNPIFVGMRLSFEPIENFETGLSRTLQLCGEGRPCGFKSWTEGLIGFGDLDNQGEGSDAIASQPGNQLASFDIAYSFSLSDKLDIKLYLEGTADDIIVVVPYTYARLLGATFYGPYDTDGSHWRVSFEAYDTTGSLAWLYGEHRKGVIYNHFIYKSGYRYFNRSIGASLDSNSIFYSLEAEFFDKNGWEYNLKYQNILVNTENDSKNTLSISRERINKLSFNVKSKTDFGNFQLGGSIMDNDINTPLKNKTNVRFGVSWELSY